MGAGIAQVAARSGFAVTLCDSSEKALDTGRTVIQQSLARLAKNAHPEDKPAQNKLVQSVFDNIRTTTDPADALSSVDLVVEAIREDLKLKQDLFRLLDRKAPAECIFATNTNTLSVGDIASSTSSNRRSRFGGLHFFNPVPQMQLVEVVRTEVLSADIYEILMGVCKRLGKTPVTCKDSPGFIVNRLLIPYLTEAIRMLERGDATIQDIDTAMKLGAGYPMGPIELADYVGLDTLQRTLADWRSKSLAGSKPSSPTDKDAGASAELFQEPALLKQTVALGRTGRHAGEGFMKYSG